MTIGPTDRRTRGPTHRTAMFCVYRHELSSVGERLDDVSIKQTPYIHVVITHVRQKLASRLYCDAVAVVSIKIMLCSRIKFCSFDFSLNLSDNYFIVNGHSPICFGLTMSWLCLFMLT